MPSVFLEMAASAKDEALPMSIRAAETRAGDISMALHTFETDTARYYLGLGRHDESSAPLFKDVDISSLDCMVLECMGCNVSSFFFDDLQYKDITRRLRDEAVPMYN